MCKLFAPRSRQITMPAPHHTIFTDCILFLTPKQKRQSTESKNSINNNKNWSHRIKTKIQNGHLNHTATCSVKSYLVFFEQFLQRLGADIFIDKCLHPPQPIRKLVQLPLLKGRQQLLQTTIQQQQLVISPIHTINPTCLPTTRHLNNSTLCMPPRTVEVSTT